MELVRKFEGHPADNGRREGFQRRWGVFRARLPQPEVLWYSVNSIMVQWRGFQNQPDQQPQSHAV